MGSNIETVKFLNIFISICILCGRRISETWNKSVGVSSEVLQEMLSFPGVIVLRSCKEFSVNLCGFTTSAENTFVSYNLSFTDIQSHESFFFQLSLTGAHFAYSLKLWTQCNHKHHLINDLPICIDTYRGDRCFICQIKCQFCVWPTSLYLDSKGIFWAAIKLFTQPK